MNELGVAEPIIQQQGADRIVVQLPGVQDTARAKEILGRTATLEVRLVEGTRATSAATAIRRRCDAFRPAVRHRAVHRADGASRAAVEKQVIITGDGITGAQPSFDQQNNEPVGQRRARRRGARIMRDVTREKSGSAWRSC